MQKYYRNFENADFGQNVNMDEQMLRGIKEKIKDYE